MASSGDSDIFKILVATDNHLGFAEKDPLRCQDSINTFEEILQIAQDNEVDFILLGGDLFHENKPPRWVQHECIRLLRRYSMSDRPINFEFVSDASINFSHSIFPHVNYEDSNLNVGMPIFSISGNHDDVSGQNLCALDVLHEAGLVNLFGKNVSVEKIEISPILLRKNGTQLALYGLGAVRDERLHRMFLFGQVKFLTFPEEAQKKDWFNLFVIHQNRVKHGATNYIPEKMLPDFLDLVIWGHEHPCFIEPTASSEKDFYVIQPGSSVATALSEGEAGDKYVALLKIKGKDFKSEKIKLKTVRPFYFEHIILSDTDINPTKSNRDAKVEAMLHKKIEDYLALAETERSGSAKQPKEPLIRLSVDYSGGFETINVVKFGHRYDKRVANPKDLLIFHRRREDTKDKANLDMDAMKRVLKEETLRVEDFVKSYFAKAEPSKQMKILTERGFDEAMKDFIDKDEKDALSELFNYQLKRCKDRLKKRPLMDENEINRMLSEIQQLRTENNKQALEEDRLDVEKALESSRRKRKLDPNSGNAANRTDAVSGGDDDDDDEDDVEMMDANGRDESMSTSSRRKGTSRGRGSSTASRPTRGRGSRGRRGANITLFLGK